MKIAKKDILEALKTITVPGEGQNMVESGAVTNVNVFGDEVIVDLTINNPSLQARKKTEVEILKVIHDQVFAKAKIKVNIKVNTEKETQSIKENKFQGLKIL